MQYEQIYQQNTITNKNTLKSKHITYIYKIKCITLNIIIHIGHGRYTNKININIFPYFYLFSQKHYLHQIKTIII